MSDELTVYLVCECCGIGQQFGDLEAAFRAGWDAPPHFTQYVACNLCPGSYIVMGEKHKHDSVHEAWRVNGRPTTFDQETCIAPEDRVPEPTLDELRTLIERGEIG